MENLLSSQSSSWEDGHYDLHFIDKKSGQLAKADVIVLIP